MLTMFKNLINEWRSNPLFYGIVFFPILGLFGLFAYEAIYMLVLEIWCIAYGLVY